MNLVVLEGIEGREAVSTTGWYRCQGQRDVCNCAFASMATPTHTAMVLSTGDTSATRPAGSHVRTRRHSLSLRVKVQSYEVRRRLAQPTGTRRELFC